MPSCGLIPLYKALTPRKGDAASVRRQSRQRLRSERRYRRNRCVPLYRYSMRAASVAPGEACLAPTTHDWQPCNTFHSPFSTKKNPGPASGIFRQHRTIQREHSARDFLSRRDLESADVLCVHQTFQTDGSAKNIRRRPKMQLCGVALICRRRRAASQKTSFVLAVRFRKSPPRTCAADPSARASGGSASPRRR